MYLPPANFQQFTINDYDSVTVLVMTFFTVGFQPEGPLIKRLKLSEVDKAEKRKASKRTYIPKKRAQTVNPKRLKLSEVDKVEKRKASKRECIRKKRAQAVNPKRLKLSEVDKAEKRKSF